MKMYSMYSRQQVLKHTYNPDLGSKINADPCGSGPCQTLPSLKIYFYMKMYSMYSRQQVLKHTYNTLLQRPF
jgi:hypothetical protein